MATAWRHLRQLKRSGAVDELDVEATIQDFGRYGFFRGPVLRPRRKNQVRLLVLVDRQGSMQPFEAFMESALSSILKGGLLGRTHVFYFHDCPEEFVYETPALTRARKLNQVLQTYGQNGSTVIFSDAGAARRDYERKRVALTREFLLKLSAYTYRYAWLNPLPQKRWAGTTAEDIARLAPMFPLERDGLDDAVNILRGNPFPPELT